MVVSRYGRSLSQRLDLRQRGISGKCCWSFCSPSARRGHRQRSSPICSIWRPPSQARAPAPTRHFSPEVFFCVFFHRTEEAISFVAQVAVIFCLLVQLDGGGGCGRRGRGSGWVGGVVLLRRCSNTSGQNKSFFFFLFRRDVLSPACQ